MSSPHKTIHLLGGFPDGPTMRLGPACHAFIVRAGHTSTSNPEDVTCERCRIGLCYDHSAVMSNYEKAMEAFDGAARDQTH